MGMHAYNGQTGEPRHEANLSTIRKEGLYISPTTALSIIHSDELEYWKHSQLIKAAYENPRRLGESKDRYARRLRAIVSEESKKTLELGTFTHTNAENILAGKPFDASSESLCILSRWCRDNIVSCDWQERVLINHDLGCAGRADAKVTFKGDAAKEAGSDPCIIDWKTQRVKFSRAKKPVYRPNYYSKWIMQLAFYASCEKPTPPVVSVVINTTEPEPPYIKRWSDNERDAAFVAFCSALHLWRYEKKVPGPKDFDLGEIIKNFAHRTITSKEQTSPRYGGLTNNEK